MKWQCSFCGKLYPQSKMKSGAWICSDCVQLLGGYGMWMSKIRTMSEAEAKDILTMARRMDENSGNDSRAGKKEKPASHYFKILLTISIVFVIVIILSYVQAIPMDVRIWTTLIAMIMFFIMVPLCFINGFKAKRREKKPKEAVSVRSWDVKDLSNHQHWIDTDKMTGVQFEQFCAMILRQSYGFVRTEMTKTSGDYGGDLVAYHQDGSKWVIQCKRYKNHVGIEAVQEVLGAKAIYEAERMAVMTNNVLTASAKELAKKSGVMLYENIKGCMEI